MNRIFCLFYICFYLFGCSAAGKPKMHIIENKISVESASLLHPTHIPRGLMLITSVGGFNTYGFLTGFVGSVYVPPGEYSLDVTVSFDFDVQDFGGPAWTIADGEKCYPLENLNRNRTLLVKEGVSRPYAKLQAGKSYEVRFGFDRISPEKPIPCTWVEEISS